MKPLLIVKTGTTVPGVRERRGDFEDWITAALQIRERDESGKIGEADASGHAPLAVEVAAVHEGDTLPPPSALAAAVVTGSSAMVSEREPWSERTAQWLAGAVEAELPLLGICYGHQLLAHGCGGEVAANPRGREIGTVEIRFDAPGDPLLGELGPAAQMQVTHVESVLRLPASARRLASSGADPHQAFALGRQAWGVQFHPEFDADVMRGYLAERRAVLTGEGLDVDALTAAVRETPAGPGLLRRFGALVRQQSTPSPSRS